MWPQDGMNATSSGMKSGIGRLNYKLEFRKNVGKFLRRKIIFQNKIFGLPKNFLRKGPDTLAPH